ncbi:outer membrane protein OmpA-like peptidoglycan-associated protein [Variovorax boronicumulans]|uniref:OmpA family protein n=1 Tax=Variovorax boronicumulans TaxID=436515 RepID=UPI0027823E80|nr:OmpA family protein [Variovorax boronicumulans]MDP9920986.1 outer membrane protein OmpA-like peptidoglycan-associated protein [Variovorax boronicumulans]
MPHLVTVSSGILSLALLFLGPIASAQPIDDVRFPDLSSTYLKTGDFIGPDHVRRIRPGMSKDQVRLELGNPHFNEGLFAVRDWDYAFNFHTGKGDEFVTCQFKVKFDHADGGYRVMSTHWKNTECALLLSPQKVALVADTPSAPSARASEKISLNADGLFRFNGATAADLLPGGRQKLEALTGDIRQKFGSVRSIVVTGHTDRLGSDSYNDALSLERAKVVRDLLASQGMDASRIHAAGMGKRQPLVVNCEGTRPTPSLIGCLQPNRRVEIEVTGDR